MYVCGWGIRLGGRSLRITCYNGRKWPFLVKNLVFFVCKSAYFCVYMYVWYVCMCVCNEDVCSIKIGVGGAYPLGEKRPKRAILIENSLNFMYMGLYVCMYVFSMWYVCVYVMKMYVV